jgi:hypothetical protein
LKNCHSHKRLMYLSLAAQRNSFGPTSLLTVPGYPRPTSNFYCPLYAKNPHVATEKTFILKCTSQQQSVRPDTNFGAVFTIQSDQKLSLASNYSAKRSVSLTAGCRDLNTWMRKVSSGVATRVQECLSFLPHLAQ